jgi:hypothetical protein
LRSFLQRGIFRIGFLVLLAVLPSRLGALSVDRGLSEADVSKLVVNSAPIGLCELVSHAAQYHRRKVRIEAIYRAGQSALYDPNCNENQSWMAVDFAQSVKGSVKSLDKLVKRDKRAKVIFEGTFFGPEPLQIDPQLPPLLKEKLSGATRRYGHLDSFETMILVSAVKRVEKVSSNVPW